jgi:hypothetical protein
MTESEYTRLDGDIASDQKLLQDGGNASVPREALFSYMKTRWSQVLYDRESPLIVDAYSEIVDALAEFGDTAIVLTDASARLYRTREKLRNAWRFHERLLCALNRAIDVAEDGQEATGLTFTASRGKGNVGTFIAELRELIADIEKRG